MTATKADPPQKLKQAIKMINQDRRRCYERLSLFWSLELYAPRQVYAALLSEGWVWCVGERKWINVHESDDD